MIEEIKEKIKNTSFTIRNGKYVLRTGTEYSRVTSVLGIAKFDNGFLDLWKNKIITKDFTNNINSGETYLGNDVLNIFNKAMSAPDQVLKNAAFFGTSVHLFIEHYLTYGEFQEVHKDQKELIGTCLESVKKFLLDFSINKDTINIVKPEMFVYSDKYRYAGSADFVCEKNNEFYLFDWKTSNGIREQYKCQLAAYAFALEETFNIHIKKATCVKFNKDSVGYEKVTLDEEALKYYFSLFLSCLMLYFFINKLPIPEELIQKF